MACRLTTSTGFIRATFFPAGESPEPRVPGKFVAGLKAAYQQRKLLFPGSLKPLAEDKAFQSFLRLLFRNYWVVCAKRPFGGPEYVLQYLARYTHRVAISNHRITQIADGQVTFRRKDYAHRGKQKLMNDLRR